MLLTVRKSNGKLGGANVIEEGWAGPENEARIWHCWMCVYLAPSATTLGSIPGDRFVSYHLILNSVYLPECDVPRGPPVCGGGMDCVYVEMEEVILWSVVPK